MPRGRRKTLFIVRPEFLQGALDQSPIGRQSIISARCSRGALRIPSMKNKVALLLAIIPLAPGTVVAKKPASTRSSAEAAAGASTKHDSDYYRFA